jgi:hypothetical protein
MRRRLTALFLILAMGLQGSVAAFAAVQPMQSDCQSSANTLIAPHQGCCPSSGSHTANCCLDACVVVVMITASPASVVSYTRPRPGQHFGTVNFFHRGDSPLIRPPIL